uniref:Uncharacterized protein n=1 Tax=viral metagenome TaxID=1070528 RepID=A0A6C0E1J6_9ZZZZ
MSEEYANSLSFVMTQTNYDYETAKTKLLLHNGNHINVVKEYMGIPIHKKNQKICSINQEIYKQLRQELDNSMRVYNDAHPINAEDVIDKFGQYKHNS